MANSLLDAIQQGIDAGKPLIWLDAEDYASKVLCAGKPLPWTDTTELVSRYGQLHSLLKPGVAPVKLDSFLAGWLDANPMALNEMRGKKRLRYALKKLLAMEEPRRQIRDIVAALCESISEPVVLVLPPSTDLVNWANRQANGAEPVALDELDIDTVSVYLGDFLRTFSGLGVAGVLVQLPPASRVDAALLDLYSPLINVARHYQWAFAVQVEQPSALDHSAGQIDLILSDQPDCANQALDQAFWSQGKVEPPGQGIYFGYVEPDLAPELVLERLNTLR